LCPLSRCSFRAGLWEAGRLLNLNGHLHCKRFSGSSVGYFTGWLAGWLADDLPRIDAARQAIVASAMCSLTPSAKSAPQPAQWH
jgi:hypothetical protein